MPHGPALDIHFIFKGSGGTRVPLLCLQPAFSFCLCLPNPHWVSLFASSTCKGLHFFSHHLISEDSSCLRLTSPLGVEFAAQVGDVAFNKRAPEELQFLLSTVGLNLCCYQTQKALDFFFFFFFCCGCLPWQLRSVLDRRYLHTPGVRLISKHRPTPRPETGKPHINLLLSLEAALQRKHLYKNVLVSLRHWKGDSNDPCVIFCSSQDISCIYSEQHTAASGFTALLTGLSVAHHTPTGQGLPSGLAVSSLTNAKLAMLSQFSSGS